MYVREIILSHNKKILREYQGDTLALRKNIPNCKCNCRKDVIVQSCPLRGKCLSKSTKYRAEVISKSRPGDSEEKDEYIANGISYPKN